MMLLLTHCPDCGTGMEGGSDACPVCGRSVQSGRAAQTWATMETVGFPLLVLIAIWIGIILFA